MKHLAIIWDSLTGGSRALAHAAAAGASATSQIGAELIPADAATPDDMCRSDAFIFVFPENLAAISGRMKTFFDRCYYPCLGQLEGRPYAILVCAGSDGSNAVRQAERIATGWRLRRIADSRIICTHADTPEAILAEKIIAAAELQAARDLGTAMAEGLALGVF